MKTLFLLRHAKSSWDDPALDDFDRPLADRGLRDAPRMGKSFRKREGPPDHLVCSPAQRARETLDLFREAARIDDLPVYDERIYGACVDEIVQIVRGFPPTAQRGLLVGHNPTLEETVRFFTRELKPMPTAALARIDFDVADWSAVARGNGQLVWHLVPKET